MKIQSPHLGALIKEIVEAKGIPHSEFAKMLGIKKQNLTTQIYNKHGLDSDKLCVISELLDCNIFDYLRSNDSNIKQELKATITIEMGAEKQDKSFRFIFGENAIEIKNK